MNKKDKDKLKVLTPEEMLEDLNYYVKVVEEDEFIMEVLKRLENK